MKQLYIIEAITGDNRRPGMPADHTWLIRYGLNCCRGWQCMCTYATEAAARTAAAAIEANGYTLLNND